jgi:uncharacterized membrane protein
MASDLTDQEAAGLILPAHIDDTVKAIAKLHLEHRRSGTAVQRAVDALTRFIARPRFAGLLTLAILFWVVANLTLPHLGRRAFDAPPFNGLQGVAGVVALFATVFILITQKREDQLSELREQLTLELAMLSEQKMAKLIGLLEELRTDLPNVHNRIDREAEMLARPADPEAVLEVLKETQLDGAAPPSVTDPSESQTF